MAKQQRPTEREEKTKAKKRLKSGHAGGNNLHCHLR
jgi:hypothetical protein